KRRSPGHDVPAHEIVARNLALNPVVLVNEVRNPLDPSLTPDILDKGPDHIDCCRHGSLLTRDDWTAPRVTVATRPSRRRSPPPRFRPRSPRGNRPASCASGRWLPPRG